MVCSRIFRCTRRTVQNPVLPIICSGDLINETKYYADEKGLVWLQKIDYDEQATMVPVCALGHMRENFDRLQEYFTAIGVKMHMYLVDEAALGAIRPDPERYEVLEDRDSFDYIYSGKKCVSFPEENIQK